MEFTDRGTRSKGVQGDSFGDAEGSWPSFDERYAFHPCEACGTPEDDRQGRDCLDGCPDCGAIVETASH